MKVKTIRFGELEVGAEEVIVFPEGILGFPELKKYCLVDSGDETLMLWMQSADEPGIAFPVLEPKIYKADYVVKLSAQELRQLRLENINQSIVFTILTIPRDVSQMSANLKAPIVVNLKEQIGRQVVLQENEYSVKHGMFKEFKAHLATIRANTKTENPPKQPVSSPINLRSMVPSAFVKTL